MEDLRLRPFEEFVSQQEKSANFEEQVKRMGSYFEEWRNGLADGNCMYRAVIAQLLDHYCHPLTPLSHFELFYKRFRHQEFAPIGSGNGRDPLIENLIIVTKVLLKLLELKRSKDPQLPRKLDLLHSSEDFTKAFIYVLRNVAIQSILYYKLEPLYWEGCEETVKETMAYGTLSGEQDFIGLSTGLDINIVQVTMGKNDYRELISAFQSRREDSQDPKLVANVALVTGHFYALYPKGRKSLNPKSPGAEQQYLEVMTRLPPVS